MRTHRVGLGTKKEQIYLFAASAPRAQRVAESLQGWADLVSCSIYEELGLSHNQATPSLVRDLAGKVDSSGSSVVLIDSQWGSTGDLWEDLSERKLVQLREELAGVSVPSSLALLSALRALGKEDPYLIIIFILEGPSVALTQEILRIGADWVWPHVSAGKLSGLLPRLRAALDAGARSKKRPKVLVVENSRSTCERIAAELETVCDLDFVGSEKPGNSFDITPDEAIEKFKDSQYDFVVVDLALNSMAEKIARERFFAGEDSSLATFYESQDASNRRFIETIWGGLEVIKGIRSISEEVAIVAMSVYLRDTTAIGIMSTYLGRAGMHRVTILEKDDASFNELYGIVRKWEVEHGESDRRHSRE